MMNTIDTLNAINLAIEALKDAHHTVEHKQDVVGRIKAITALRKALASQKEALAEQPAPVQQCMDHGECFGGKCIYPAPQPAQQQEPKTKDVVIANMGDPFTVKAYVIPQPAQQESVAKVCHDLDGHIGWNPNLRQLPDEGTALYTSPPTLSLAQRPHECSRSHPHENMNAMCELRTEIARLTNENARLKALHQGDEINTYRMTLLCIRDGLQQGMSKSIQKLQAREINDVLGLPSFASYRTSPPAQRTWVGLNDTDLAVCGNEDDVLLARYWERVCMEKNT